MANICKNELHVYSENRENIKYVKDFFNKRKRELDAVYTYEDYTNLEFYFDSKWNFPRDMMEDLYNNIPDKNNITIECLSVEWGNLYCSFHECDEDGWREVNN